MFIIIVTLILVGIANSEMDTIKFKPEESFFPKWKWWVESGFLNNQTRKPILRWLIKYPFSFLLDGWHLMKSIMITIICLSFTLLFMLIPENGNLDLITATGVFFLFFLIISGTFLIFYEA